MLVRPTKTADRKAVDQVLKAAFPTDAEARLVKLLRAAGDLTISLVAEESQIIGYVSLSPVTHPHLQKGLGLAPIAVHPDYQKRGIGAALIEAAHRAARELGFHFIVLLGSPNYYPRFGYRPASEWGIQNEYGVDEPFMAYELKPGALSEATGLVRYCSAFEQL